MELTVKARKELQKVVQSDYGVALSNTQANKLGVSLLRLTRLARNASESKTSV